MEEFQQEGGEELVKVSFVYVDRMEGCKRRKQMCPDWRVEEEED